MDNIALIDMDGTLCDYDSAMRDQLAKLASPGEPTFGHGDLLPDWMEARRELISKVPGFWKGLKRHEPGFEIVRVLEEFKFELHILTKGPKKKRIAWMEKAEWIDEHLPQAGMGITEKKALTYGKVLVDDWPSYYKEWLKVRPRGLVIVPAQPWNVDAEAYAPGNILRYTGNQDQLRRVLEAVRNRPSGMPLVLPPP
jgi:5'-nucleotidase